MTPRNNPRPHGSSPLVQHHPPTLSPASKKPGAVDARARSDHVVIMPDIWGRQTEKQDLPSDKLREDIQLHLTRKLDEPHIAFSDEAGWAGRTREPGPPVDVLVIPPEGERRFAYVCTFGSSLKKKPADAGGRMEFVLAVPQRGDPSSLKKKPADAGGRMEFVLAVPQRGDPQADLKLLNLAANTVRQFAKLVHIQNIRVAPGQTVQFTKNPKPVFEGANQVGFAFMAPRLPNDGFHKLRVSEGDSVTFWAPVPICREELDAGAMHGAERLAAGLEHAGVTEMLHFDRPSVARRAHGLGRPLLARLKDLVRPVLRRD